MNNIISNIRPIAKVFLMATALILTSCEKDDETPPSDNNGGNQNQESDNFPTVDGDGQMVAINSISTTDTPIGPIQLTIGTAVAVFTDDSFTSFIDAGTVSVNGSTLDNQNNDSYTFTDISMANPNGLDFSSAIAWDVTGGSGIPAFSHNAYQYGFPTVGEITSSTMVDKSMGYILSSAGVSGADSVIFNIGGVIKTIPGNAVSCEFTAADLDGLSNGPTVVQVAAYTLTQTDQGGRTIYFTNETVQTLSATVE